MMSFTRRHYLASLIIVVCTCFHCGVAIPLSECTRNRREATSYREGNEQYHNGTIQRFTDRIRSWRGKRSALTIHPNHSGTSSFNRQIVEPTAADEERCINNKKPDDVYTDAYDEPNYLTLRGKRTQHTYMGQHSTLCWTELTTIKEDQSFNPAKRVAIREYIISYENSAYIQDRYLDCTKYEGELDPFDPEYNRTTIPDVITTNTRRSKNREYTYLESEGNILIWQHRFVKCAVGPVLTKTISHREENPARRLLKVELKLSPDRFIPGLPPLFANVTDASNIEDPTTEVPAGTTLEDKITTPTDLLITSEYPIDVTVVTTVGEDDESAETESDEGLETSTEDSSDYPEDSGPLFVYAGTSTVTSTMRPWTVSSYINESTTPPPRPDPHRLHLEVKVVLEHAHEDDGSEDLLNLSKHLDFQEGSVHDERKKIVTKIKTLNETVTDEALESFVKTIGLSEMEIRDRLGMSDVLQRRHVSDVEHAGKRQTSKRSLRSYKPEDSNLQIIDTGYTQRSQVDNISWTDLRRFLLARIDYEDLAKLNHDSLTEEDLKQLAKGLEMSLPALYADIAAGISHILVNLQQKDNGLTKLDDDTLNDRHRKVGGTTKNLKRRPRGTMKEIAHWSNERVNDVSSNTKLRSFAEFTLYKV